MEFESIKIEKVLVEKLRWYKSISGVPIATFIKQCVEPQVNACIKKEKYGAKHYDIAMKQILKTKK